MEVEPYPTAWQEGPRSRINQSSENSIMPASPFVKLLGTQENGMALISPPRTSRVIGILQQINKMMQERVTKAKFVRWIEADTDSSVRYIQGGRMEIFLQATGKSSNAFDTIVGKRLARGAKDLVLKYAQKQAQLDPRLQQQQNYKFGNFSLICSFDMVDAQAPHIDLIKPNHQFGLMVSEGGTSTLFFESNHHVQSVDALVEQWKRMASAWNNPDEPYFMSSELIQAMKQEPAMQMLLQCFGDVLLPARYVLYNMKKENNLPTGSIISLPASVVHAAPATAKFRAVIFFSGCPCQMEVAEYHPDTQYTGVMLAGHIASLMWKKPGVGFKERLYLLQRLAQYVEGSTVRDNWGHFAPGNLANFVGNIEKKNTTKQEEYIREMAKSEEMGSPHDPFSGGTEVEEEDDAPDLKDYQLVSVKDLYTLWEEEEFHVEIYRRISDGKVLLRYPKQGNQEDDEFEGSRPNENFRLIMKPGYQQCLFDAKNGDLLDSEGEMVDIYRGRIEDM